MNGFGNLKFQVISEFEPSMILTPKCVLGRDFGVGFLIDKCHVAFQLYGIEYWSTPDAIFYCDMRTIALSKGMHAQNGRIWQISTEEILCPKEVHSCNILPGLLHL